jgi:hypothetical protein
VEIKRRASKQGDARVHDWRLPKQAMYDFLARIDDPVAGPAEIHDLIVSLDVGGHRHDRCVRFGDPDQLGDSLRAKHVICTEHDEV